MSNGKFNLSETELVIMEYIWSQPSSVTFSQLLAYFTGEGGKTWKKQTLNTFLTRLIAKGVLRSEKIGTKFHYFPVGSRDEHVRIWTQDLIKNVYGASLKNFMVALTGGNKLDEKSYQELKAYLNNEEE